SGWRGGGGAAADRSRPRPSGPTASQRRRAGVRRFADGIGPINPRLANCLIGGWGLQSNQMLALRRTSFKNGDYFMSTDEKKAAEAEAKPTPPSDNVSISQHTAVINGQTIAYTVTCGTIILKEEAEKEGKS